MKHVLELILDDKDLYELEILNNKLKDVQEKKKKLLLQIQQKIIKKAAELKTEECKLLDQIERIN